MARQKKKTRKNELSEEVCLDLQAGSGIDFALAEHIVLHLIESAKMDASQNPVEGANRAFAIQNLEPRFDALYLTISCAGCDEAYASAQPTVAGQPVGEHTCPSCKKTWAVTPAMLTEAVSRCAPPPSTTYLMQVLMEASRIAHTWADHDEVRPLFEYDGIQLGSLTAQVSFPHIAQGLIDFQLGAR